MAAPIAWPEGRRFAFSIFDDTDLMTVRNGRPVYDLLADLGFRTTKSVWPISGQAPAQFGGSTCEDPDYLTWVLTLQDRGFELGLHGVTYGSASRPEIQRGLEVFKDRFGAYPSAHTNHAGSQDGVYWGAERLTGTARIAYRVLRRFSRQQWWGHVPGNPYFWGDLCRSRITYVRNFVFRDINTLRACPPMPYHDPNRPYVNYWFASTEGANCRSFVRAISEEHQDRLEAEGGACIMYTHLALGFAADATSVDQLFERRMRRLAGKDGWFVPVTTLLDYIRQQRGEHVISSRERGRLERKWLAHKLCVGGTT